MKRIILAALVGLVVSGPAMAAKDNNSGNQLLENCTGETYIEKGMCIGFVTGFMHGRYVFRERGGVVLYCESPHVTIGQRRDIVINYLQAHPESRHQLAGKLYALAMKEKFPCKQEPKK
jgi:hypothetical protein